MIDVFEVAKILIDAVKIKYADDIAIVAYYGSYARGTAIETSDLDIFYIPDNERGLNASFQFILAGIGFDFWPITWERAENMASFNESKVSVIAESKILYSRSEADLNRFMKLKDKISEMCKPENRRPMLKKAFKYLKDCYMYLYNMKLPTSKNNLTITRIEADKIITAVLDSCALLNQTYFKAGWSQNMEQILALKLKPSGLGEMINDILEERNPDRIKNSCEKLVSGTRELLISEQRKLSKSYTYSDVFKGYYEEIKSLFNKIIRACEKNDYTDALSISTGIQDEISRFLAMVEEGIKYTDFNTYCETGRIYSDLDLPNLAGIIEKGKLDVLRNAIIKLDEKLKKILEVRGICLNIFDNLEEFKVFVKNKT
ncbi:MAG: nucleotidyltransferase domain-containing protein [bacterium]